MTAKSRKLKHSHEISRNGRVVGRGRSGTLMQHVTNGLIDRYLRAPVLERPVLTSSVGGSTRDDETCELLMCAQHKEH
jgi:hypothetical protein